MPFENQLTATDLIAQRFETEPRGDLRDEAEICGITCFTDRLNTLNDTFRGEL